MEHELSIRSTLSLEIRDKMRQLNIFPKKREKNKRREEEDSIITREN